MALRIAIFSACFLSAIACAAEAKDRFVSLNSDGRLEYAVTSRGDRMPDFSCAGYGGGKAIPLAEVKLVVSPHAVDMGPAIQSALDAVAKLPPDKSGLRGAVLLRAGKYEVTRNLKLISGVVLRGQGAATELIATGQDRRAVIRLVGTPAPTPDCEGTSLAAEYVPCGAQCLEVSNVTGLSIGTSIRIEHPSTKDWIAALGMDRFPSRDRGSYLDWRPNTLDLAFERTITSISGRTIELDAPLPMALDAKLSNVRVRPYRWPNRLRMAGVENLRLISAVDRERPNDEDHAWTGVVVEHAEDVWVRDVTFEQLAGSAVAVWETARRVTVADCKSKRPVSESGGQRRMTFHTAGQQTLFLRCSAEDGRRDFTTGHLACGPNAFVHCQSQRAAASSGAMGSWATGVLFDNVEIDGGGLALTNREIDDQGVGWAAANSVLWQCTAANITCRMPPTAQNWAIGVWGQFVGDGHWRELNEFSKPASLFEQQLLDRLGAQATEVRKPATYPAETATLPTDTNVGTPHLNSASPSPDHPPLAIKNGWLTVGDSLVIGRRQGTVWWRGHTLPARAAELGVGVTRFVPGREGVGYTDDLDELAHSLSKDGVAALDHHWGLWYDRRRDDHQMLRRADGEVWAPFYELPWVRSGRGAAWDGLSNYDLERFNPWYFSRLREFARAARSNGLLLVQQMYFQHNFLEAGAHWADFPWRPANCWQATGFPEPPEYVGKKRVFMAEEFYDVSHPVRRGLHRKYIRHCLDELGAESNVIFQLGEEFSGPLPFAQFWLDTIAEWCEEHDRRVIVGLSCPKDVQDSILNDSARAAWVSLVDIKYWWYTSSGELYNPTGGVTHAPRQHLREWHGDKSRSAESLARSVNEYRLQFPDKAVTVSLEGAPVWSILAAGASLPNLPRDTSPALRRAVPFMKPQKPNGQTYCVARPGQEYLAWSPTKNLAIDLSDAKGRFKAFWIDSVTGLEKATTAEIAGGKVVEFSAPTAGASIIWLVRAAGSGAADRQEPED